MYKIRKTFITTIALVFALSIPAFANVLFDGYVSLTTSWTSEAQNTGEFSKSITVTNHFINETHWKHGFIEVRLQDLKTKEIVGPHVLVPGENVTMDVPAHFGTFEIEFRVSDVDEVGPYDIKIENSMR